MNYREASTLLWMQIQEKSALKEGLLSQEEVSAVTKEASKQVGEAAEPVTFLSARAALLMKKYFPQSAEAPKLLRTWGITAGILLISFILGLATQQIASDTHRINLLSPPLILFILWNLAVYLYLAAAFLVKNVLKRTVAAPLRRHLSNLLLKIVRRGSKEKSVTAFWAEMVPMCRKSGYAYVAFLLHSAAVMLTLGFIAGMSLRGFSTAYTAGWESTWLSGKPEAVLAVLNFFYSWVPFADTTLTLSEVEAMQFIGNQTGAAGAPWMIAIMASAVIFVVIPRSALAFIAALRQRSAANNLALNLNQPYFVNLIRQWRGKKMNIQVIPFATAFSPAEQSGLEAIASELGLGAPAFDIAGTVFEDDKLPELQGETECWAVFSMGATGEADVQGVFIEELKKLCKKQNVLLRVFVNAASFEKRFSGVPARIEERRRSWKSFLEELDVHFAIVNFEKPDGRAAEAFGA